MNGPMVELPKIFANKHRAFVVAPAGCGKTELIARSVMETEGVQLLLTHTHAGVKSLRDRLKKVGVPSHKYRIDTIAGFSLLYATAFPLISNCNLNPKDLPKNEDWPHIYEGATKVVNAGVGQDILINTYTGIFVDEYQDCEKVQHQLIMTIAQILPCRIVGDPLQGIFDFGGQVLVDWANDLEPYFERLPDLQTPWRWKDNNELLGKWLLEVREKIIKGEPIDLRYSPVGVKWSRLDRKNQIVACLSAGRNADINVVAIHTLPPLAHLFASSLNGIYTSMEEVECKDLIKYAKLLESKKGVERILALVEFASKCMTGVNTNLSTIIKRITSGKIEKIESLKNGNVGVALSALIINDSFLVVFSALLSLRQMKGKSILYRRELWFEMLKAVESYARGEGESLADIAWRIRDNGRILGRQIPQRAVSRTHLIKGLEFDHSIVLDADNLDAKQLYVALTRGSKYLTVLSKSPVIKNEPVKEYNLQQLI